MQHYQSQRNYLRDSRKKVAFSTVEFREFPIVLGDNPSISTFCAGELGPPVTIGWEPQAEYSLSVGAYERFREPRKGNQLRLSSRERLKLVRQSGHSHDEILDAVDEAIKIQRSRFRCNNQKNWDKLHAAMESTSRTTLENVTKLCTNSVLKHSTGARTA